VIYHEDFFIVFSAVYELKISKYAFRPSLIMDMRKVFSDFFISECSLYISEFVGVLTAKKDLNMLKKQGLYLPEFEHDNCGAGFICSLTGKRSNDIIHKALEILVKLEHRGAVSSDGVTGDGAGILIDIPHAFFEKFCEFTLPSP